jgi:hypothetical protein
MRCMGGILTQQSVLIESHVRPKPQARDIKANIDERFIGYLILCVHGNVLQCGTAKSERPTPLCRAPSTILRAKPNNSGQRRKRSMMIRNKAGYHTLLQIAMLGQRRPPQPTGLWRQPDTHARSAALRPRLHFVDSAFCKADAGYHPAAATALHALPSVLADVCLAFRAFEAAVELALFEFGFHP